MPSQDPDSRTTVEVRRVATDCAFNQMSIKGHPMRIGEGLV